MDKNTAKPVIYSENEHKEFFQSSLRQLTTNIPIHRHTNIEIALIIDGQGENICNDIPCSIKKGDLYVMRVTDYHEIRTTRYLDIYSLNFIEQVLPEDVIFTLNSINGNIALSLNDNDFNAIKTMFEYCSMAEKQFQNNERFIKNILECILIYIFRLGSFKKILPKDKQIHSFNKAITYLHEHFRENIRLDYLAEISHYTPNHFSTIFHREMHTTYNDYLNDLRIKHAKQLLTTTNLKIIDVGFQSGFNSYNNFYNTFKKNIGISPTVYRENNTNKSHLNPSQPE